ncbi:NAD(P)-dependent oxidoreductase [Streptomyces sp. NBC_01231]|nr:NAD(P)-dependent oxidoreductase [Streptomyces sp. NBC_01231]
MSGTPAGCAVVVGGTGFLGRHICTALAALGHDVLAVARTPVDPVPGTRFRSLDVTSAPAGDIAEALHGADVVVNAAGDTGAEDEERMTAEHVLLADRLVSALAAQRRRPRLLHLGTVHEYGPVPDGTAIAETHPTAPVSVYARTKLAGSRVVLEAVEKGRVEGSVLRVTNGCGPGAPVRGFLGRLAARLRTTAQDAPLTLTLADDRRDFVDVRDVAEAVVLAVHARQTRPLYNIGSGTATSMRELAGILVAASGVPPHLVREGHAPVHSKGGAWTQADIRLARELLGWSPRVPLQRSLHDLWAAS